MLPMTLGAISYTILAKARHGTFNIQLSCFISKLHHSITDNLADIPR